MDDEAGYYRGVAWYKKILPANKKFKGKNIFLHFEGANQQTTVFVNGKKAGEHTGGYNAFSVDLTAFFISGKSNEIIISVDNSHNKNIPPLSADFTFYGGIYRDVYLVATEPVHFLLGKDGSKSIFIATPQVSRERAGIDIAVHVQNVSAKSQELKLTTAVYDGAGREILSKTTGFSLAPGQTKKETQQLSLLKPTLWSVDDPYLYKAVTKITNASSGKLLDELTTPIGFRWFRFDAAKGFFLNDKPLKLIGASRHQDYKGLGNAVPDSLARKDVQLLKDMGANFLRVAHYPQDPAVLKACDELGILASVEIPVVNEITESDSFYNNCLQMQVEMIRQHFNHPSVIMWCYMNEILLRPSFNNDKPRQKKYFSNIAALAKKLDSVTMLEDPGRYTMIAHHGNYNIYKEAGLIDIPMIIGWNLYQGWYGSNINDLPVYLDRFHEDYPRKPMLITEYGADADPRIRSKEPVRFDKSIEYATFYHQYYYEQIMQRPFVAGAMVWNLADFNSETRNETMPHINNKGLLQWNRNPKDPYYYYQAMLRKKPFVKILGAAKIAGTTNNDKMQITQQVNVASNMEAVSLWVNGNIQGSSKVENGIAKFRAVLLPGKNALEARSQKDKIAISDNTIIECQVQPAIFTGSSIAFSPLNILLGASRTFEASTGELWIPGQAYITGNFGYIGGKAFKLPKGQLPYGTDKNIRGTVDDPIYQTQQVGINSFKFDVPDGQYELTLHFAELLGGSVEGILYNLTEDGRTEKESNRVFNVLVNEQSFLQNFNIAKEAGHATPLIKKIKLTAVNNAGIKIGFHAIEGETVLNALQLKKAGNN